MIFSDSKKDTARIQPPGFFQIHWKQIQTVEAVQSLSRAYSLSQSQCSEMFRNVIR